ncbi:MAG: hypothetical protein CVT49_09725 [candidate division Zixibacteria bacterium HGW-Zixibacteria-1]|nr:MAG: hypothetical protein CVT49_09725 [candidate division Zixibacteria bacterium HGW-Zixibacteria-1]
MYERRKLRKSPRYTPPRGIKLERRRRFEPTIATKSGINVRSKYEKKCADFLFENKIEFQYEPLILLAGKQYRPDFFLPDQNLFLEICGYNHMPFYVDRVGFKRQLYEKHNLRAIFIHYNGKGSLEEELKKSLAAYGFQFRQ